MKAPHAAFVGVISDTHGLLRPEAMEALQGARVILHAGDIGSAEVIAGLEQIAPVHAVRGNVDGAQWAQRFPETRDVCIDGCSLHILHDLGGLDPAVIAKGIQVVVSGHSHKPLVRRDAGVLYLNPGSAGPRRFRLPVCVARLRLTGREPEAEIIELAV